ncbi:MAG: hypothetical protein JNK64_34195 [Myxococcales bacterium]|nr:hypothetical protein [Myxococcales bacterium]
MTSRVLRMIAVTCWLALALGCLPKPVPYSVRKGDDYFQKGDYESALKRYQEAAKSGSTPLIEGRIAKARGKLVELALVDAEQALTAGKLDAAMAMVAAIHARFPAQPEVRAFATRHQQRWLDEADRHRGAGRPGRAFVLARRAAAVLTSDALAKAQAGHGAAWADALAKALAGAPGPATQVLLQAAQAVATQRPAPWQEARRAREALVAQQRLAVTVEGKGVAAAVKAAVDGDPRFASGAGAGREKVVARVTIGALTGKTDVTRRTERQQVEQGTHQVPNPNHAAILDEIAAIESDIAFQQDNIASSTDPAYVEATRYQISGMQDDLADRRAELAQTPPTLSEPAYVDVDYQVETHRLIASRPVTVEVRFASGGAAITRTETIRVERTDEAHAANPRLGLAADRVELPAPQALTGDLDQATARWFATVLDEAHAAYRQRLLAGARDRREGLALYLLLAPAPIEAALDTELSDALDIPEPSHLAAKLSAGRPDEVYVVAATATATPGTPTPGAGTKPTPGAGTKPTAGAGTRPTAGAGTRPTTGVGTKPPAGPASPPDPDAAMRSHGGYALKLTAFSFSNGGKERLRVDRDGKLYSRGRHVGTWNTDGTFVASGRIALAIDRQGRIWFNERAPVERGKLTKSDVTFTAGATIDFDSTGHVVAIAGGKRRTSAEVIAPASAAGQPVALLSAYLGMGVLTLR